MDIERTDLRSSGKIPDDWLSGDLRVDALFQATSPAFVQGASLTLERGACTAWRKHPLGMSLIVTAGCGWVERDGVPVAGIRPGDVVLFQPSAP